LNATPTVPHCSDSSGFQVAGNAGSMTAAQTNDCRHLDRDLPRVKSMRVPDQRRGGWATLTTPSELVGQTLAVDPMVTLIEHGMLLESAHGPLPSVSERVAGEQISL